MRRWTILIQVHAVWSPTKLSVPQFPIITCMCSMYSDHNEGSHTPIIGTRPTARLHRICRNYCSPFFPPPPPPPSIPIGPKDVRSFKRGVWTRKLFLCLQQSVDEAQSKSERWDGPIMIYCAVVSRWILTVELPATATCGICVTAAHRWSKKTIQECGHMSVNCPWSLGAPLMLYPAVIYTWTPSVIKRREQNNNQVLFRKPEAVRNDGSVQRTMKTRHS